MFYVFRNDTIICIAYTYDSAMLALRSYQADEKERYYFGEAQYSLIEGGKQVFIPYPDEEEKAKRAKK